MARTRLYNQAFRRGSNSYVLRVNARDRNPKLQFFVRFHKLSRCRTEHLVLSQQPVFPVQTRKLTALLEEAESPLLNLLDRFLHFGEYRGFLFPFKCRTLSIKTVDIVGFLSINSSRAQIQNSESGGLFHGELGAGRSGLAPSGRL